MNDLAPSSDMERVAERLIPFAPRGETRERLKELAGEYKEKLSNIESLEGERLSCPVCMSPDNVIIAGNGRNGTKKFVCCAEHAELEGRSDGAFRFSTYTSYEALRVYRDFLTEAMSLLTLCGGTYEGIAEYLGISTYAVELGVSAFADYIASQEGRGEISVEGDVVVIYADFSSTRVSRRASIIMSKVGDAIAYQVDCSMNYMTAWNFASALKKRLEVGEGTIVVFVTDGDKAWVDPIRRFFPGAVHVRQFHSRSSRGIIYVHFPYEGKLYTFRCLWDLVLGEGEPGKRVLEMRRRRAAEMEGKDDDDKTGLYEGIILWEGVVREPRGVRRKKAGATGSGAMKIEKGELKRDSGDPAGTEAVEGEMSGWKTIEGIAPEGGAPQEKEVFRGSLEDALTLPQVAYIYALLAEVFRGLYITSNAVECLFNVKPALKYHRAVKNGEKLISVLLYARTRLRLKSGREVRRFFREIFTMDRLRTMVVRRDARAGERREKREEIERAIFTANDYGLPVVISYRDRKGRRTSRMIEPLEIVKDSYTGGYKVEAYCYLRDDERTFLLDRITDAIPQNLDLTVVG